MFQIKENLQGRIVRFQTERWTVPWTGQTIAQVSSSIHLLRWPPLAVTLTLIGSFIFSMTEWHVWYVTFVLIVGRLLKLESYNVLSMWVHSFYCSLEPIYIAKDFIGFSKYYSMFLLYFYTAHLRILPTWALLRVKGLAVCRTIQMRMRILYVYLFLSYGIYCPSWMTSLRPSFTYGECLVVDCLT